MTPERGHGGPRFLFENIPPALASRDQGKAQAAGGVITMDEYFAKVKRGEG